MAMTMPGFTADAAAGWMRPGGRGRAARGARGGNGASAQLKGGSFGGRSGGRLGTLGDYWTCKDRCYRAWSVCVDSCEGTWESPKPSRNCVLCDQDYLACVWNCKGDIA